MPEKDPMNIAPQSPLSTFFLGRLTYDIETLALVLEVDGRPTLEVSFASARAFRSFSESDYWHYLRGYEGRALLPSTDSGCGILLSETAPYLLDYRAHARHQEDEPTFSCLIKTPQECVEVICFEEPSVRAI